LSDVFVALFCFLAREDDVFDLDRFIEECRVARAADADAKGVRDIVQRAISEPASIMRALGEPRRAEFRAVHRSADLTVLHLVWGPRMMIPPHNHLMWAVIGIYSGREDNTYWRRVRGASHGHIEAAGAKSLATGDLATLGRDVIHSVVNPIPRLTAAIHVYGGDFFATERSEWDPESLAEGRYDAERTRRLFAESNAALAS
jgi:predicted metal-dependent enzyme (double-stranded beta helix superfamily)